MRLAITERITELIETADRPLDALAEEYRIKPESLTSLDLTEPASVTAAVNEILAADKVTLREMLTEICTADPKRPFITFDGKKLTCAEMLNNVKSIVSGMLDIGIKKGDRTAIILDNCLEFIYAYFALFCLGALPVPVNIRWKKNELFNILDDADVSFIICSEKAGTQNYGSFIAEYMKEHEKIKKVFYTDNNLYGESGLEFASLLASGPLDEEQLEEIDPDDIAMISYTSGTTGMPKGVLLKNNNIYKISKYSAEYWCAGHEERPFSIAPLYSAQGFLSLLINVATECDFKMISSFNPNDIVKEISKCENTIIHTQPTMWNLLLSCRIIDFARFDSLNTLVVSGSLCAPTLAKRIEDKLQCELMNAYGLIEGTSVVTMTRLHDPEDVRFNTVGRPIEGVEIKIVDENRVTLPKGETGELAVRGYNMAGYYNNPQKTSEVIDEDGWLYTGDLARYYDEENISIVGRCKDMIIRGGFNVYPSDIEECIMQLPEIQTAAVVGSPHDILGEEIRAFVVVKAGKALTDRDIFRHLFTRIANYKMPDKVHFISEMPIILAGKVDKKELELWAAEGIPENKQVLFLDREDTDEA